MYVSESGVAGAGDSGRTQSGRVTKYAPHSTVPVWSDSFTSYYNAQSPGAQPDVLGPEGISAVGYGCMKPGPRPGCKIRMIMSESTPGIAAQSGGTINDPQAGHLYQLNGATGTPTDLADVGSQQYAFTNAHKDLFPPDFPDSNPYGVLVTRDSSTGATRTFVADAGANTISEVRSDGTTRIIAYIPNENSVPFRDATPTCIAQGPDGYLYVGTLHFVSNLFVHSGRQSDVWRVDPNADFPTAPTVWASGLTTLTACTFDRSGNFWGTEMFRGGLGATPPGDVVKIGWRHPLQRHHFGFGRLPVPGGIAQGPDGAMYITVGSSAAGVSGGVVRLKQG
jgi:glucose/arabinose dehydrogenase